MVRLNLPKERTFKGPAALWKRVLAFMVDFLIIDFVIGQPFQKVFAKVVPAAGFSESLGYLQSSPEKLTLLSFAMIFYGLLALLYFSILEYKTDQTIGKMFMRIKVESEHKSYFMFLVRSLFLLFIFPFMLLIILDPIFMLFNKEGKRLSEILSKTRTVEVYAL